MRKQLIVSSSKLQLVAMLATAGYPYRYVSSEGNYLFEDTGDIDLMVEDFEKGAQGITDCKALLTTYDELLRQSGGQSSSQTFTAPANGPQLFNTRNIAVMGLLQMYGFTLHIGYDATDGKMQCSVHDDGTAKDIMALYKRGELNVNALMFDRAMFKVRAMLKSTPRPGQNYALPTSLSSRNEGEAA